MHESDPMHADMPGEPYPSSLWAATAPQAAPRRPLAGNEEADVAIVGGGFTGLSAALHLAREGRVVRLLELGQPGFGCSGRNGGQVNPGGTRLFPDEVVRALGHERGERFLALADESCDLVFELIEAYGIDCEAVRPGFVQGGWGRSGARYAEAWTRQWGERGVAVEPLTHAALATLIGTERYDNGFHDPRGGNVQPLAYALGLAAAAEREGAVLHGGTRAIGVERDGADWCVRTTHGTVRAEHLLLCTNGYTDGLWPGLAESVVCPSTFVAATAPLGANVLGGILPGRHAVSESSRVIVYYRLDARGRFVIGGRGNFLDSGGEGSARHVAHAAERLFPELEGVAWEYRWSGWPAMTRSHLPMLIGLDRNAHAGLGYNGRGVAMATVMGRELARVVLGEAIGFDVRPLARSRFALHPFRQLGISAHLLHGVALDALERRRSGHRGVETA